MIHFGQHLQFLMLIISRSTYNVVLFLPETDDVKFSDEGEENEDAEAEEASLKAVLDARKACARALKAPGSKRNWNAGRKLPESGSMPKLVRVFQIPREFY